MVWKLETERTEGFEASSREGKMYHVAMPFTVTGALAKQACLIE